MEQLLRDTLDRVGYLSRESKIIIEIMTTSALNGYGYNVSVKASLQELLPFCRHCGYIQSDAKQFCLGDGLHNFKPTYVVVTGAVGITIEEALKGLSIEPVIA